MGLHFTINSLEKCAICGSGEQLTREHKIKSSLLKEEFGNIHMAFYGKDKPDQARIVQSVKSKYLKFKTKICAKCNTARTQPADKAFHNLHSCLKDLYDNGCKLTDSHNRPNCSEISQDNLDVFRYFAKIMCCFMAEVGGPRPRRIALFSIRKIDNNPIKLQIKEDTDYKRMIKEGINKYASHGGLLFRFDDEKQYVKAIESSLKVGGIHYLFWVELNWCEAKELELSYPNLVQTARLSIMES